jgi:hypothetical protein
MNTRKITLGLVALLLATSSGSLVFFSGCSSSDDNGNPMPTKRDSGTDTTQSDTGTGSESGSDAKGDTVSETSLPDVGSCKSDSSSCNTCYDDAEAKKDPLNACSPYTANCVPVSLTVPSHPAIP